MRSTCLWKLCAVSAAVLAFQLYCETQAQAAGELVTKVYPVADLVFVAPNYPFEGIDAGTVGAAPKIDGGGGGGLNGGGFGGGGIGGGGGGGGYGGGGFQIPPENVQHMAHSGGGGVASPLPARQIDKAISGVSIDQLIDVIEGSIESTSWSSLGGNGTITSFGGRLIVTQTAEIHTAIEKLLTALRTQGGAQSTVTVRAWWLRLDNAQYQKLCGETPTSSPPRVNRKVLQELADDRTVDYGQVTCFDGQTVHIISGRFRNAITGVTPVVGQLDPPAQADGSVIQLAGLNSSVNQPKIWLVAGETNPTAPNDQAMPVREGNVGYQPQSATQHAGAMLQFTPTRLPESKAVILDLKSVVNCWNEQPEKPVDFRNIIALDRMNVVSQQLSTTLKVPLREPVLVGGLSLEPGAVADNNAKVQLYLVVEVIDESK